MRTYIVIGGKQKGGETEIYKLEVSRRYNVAKKPHCHSTHRLSQAFSQTHFVFFLFFSVTQDMLRRNTKTHTYALTQGGEKEKDYPIYAFHSA
jgi:hypothetical protein